MHTISSLFATSQSDDIWTSKQSFTLDLKIGNGLFGCATLRTFLIKREREILFVTIILEKYATLILNHIWTRNISIIQRCDFKLDGENKNKLGA